MLFLLQSKKVAEFILTYISLIMLHFIDLIKFVFIFFSRTLRSLYFFVALAKTALVKSRDLHWGLLATRDHKEINLSSLRSILVADGANPWSLSSCDQFASIFKSRGLRLDAICPCAGSSETGTVSLRRSSFFGFFFSRTSNGILHIW